MMSRDDSVLCVERFGNFEDHLQEVHDGDQNQSLKDTEGFAGKAKECHVEGEKNETKKTHHHHHHLHEGDRDFIVDEDGTKIETLSADIEIRLSGSGEMEDKEDYFQMQRDIPKTEVIRRRCDKKRERKERKERKRQQLRQQEAAPGLPSSSPSSSSTMSSPIGLTLVGSVPQRRFPMLLVLDLDGTLVHSEFQRRTYQQHDFSLFNDEIFVFKRPYLDYFVSTILEWFDVAVWTASGCEYAAEIVRHVFPDPSKISFLFSSERCTNKYCPSTGERLVIKDMKKVKRRGYDLRQVLIVDDTPSTWQRNYGNAIHIESYWGSRIDDHLLHLLTYLEYIGHEKDVRVVDKRRWRSQVLSAAITLPPSSPATVVVHAEEAEEQRP